MIRKTILGVVAAALLAIASGCTAPKASSETLRRSGYTNIETGGYDFFSCGQDDAFATHFRAKNPQGVEVEGTVCCGLLKSCTVRF